MEFGDITVRERELGKLRLGMPVDTLARIMGDEWSPPGPRDKGKFNYKVWGDGLGPDYLFSARITTDGTLGSLGYYGKFPKGVAIGRLSIGMTIDAAKAGGRSVRQAKRTRLPMHLERRER